MNFDKYTELSQVQKVALLLNVFGNDLATQVLQQMPPGSKSEVTSIMQKIRKVPASVVQRVVNDFKEDFVSKSEDFSVPISPLKFEDIPCFEDQGLKLVLKQVSTDKLIIAMRTASEDIRDKIYRNISSRAVSMFVEDNDGANPARLSEVESAQKEIIEIAEKLRASGNLRVGESFSSEVVT